MCSQKMLEIIVPCPYWEHMTRPSHGPHGGGDGRIVWTPRIYSIISISVLTPEEGGFTFHSLGTTSTTYININSPSLGRARNIKLILHLKSHGWSHARSTLSSGRTISSLVNPTRYWLSWWFKIWNVYLRSSFMSGVFWIPQFLQRTTQSS